MRKLLLFLLVLFAIALVACTDFERQTFQTLATLQQTYNSVEQVYVAGRKAGTVSAADYATYRGIADAYVPVHNTAVNYLFAYHAAVSSGDTKKQAALQASLQALVPELVRLVGQLKQLPPVQLTTRPTAKPPVKVSTSYAEKYHRTTQQHFDNWQWYRGGTGFLRGAAGFNS